MPKADSLPGPCLLCGSVRGNRFTGVWECSECTWRYGDVPDAGLPLPRIDVVYYLRYNRRVKIGTSRQPRRRLASILHHELLAFERGDRIIERRRHEKFADIREGGEWFTFTAELEEHVAALRDAGEPWKLYARWLSETLQSGGSVN